MSKSTSVAKLGLVAPMVAVLSRMPATTTIIFCSGGEWWALDCQGIGGDFCGDDGETVDCYAF